jgi:hypothetical protein
MSTRYLGIAMIVIGVLVVLISVFADSFGIGAQASVFGWKQILGTVVGAVVCLAGIVVSLRK